MDERKVLRFVGIFVCSKGFKGSNYEALTEMAKFHLSQKGERKTTSSSSRLGRDSGSILKTEVIKVWESFLNALNGTASRLDMMTMLPQDGQDISIKPEVIPAQGEEE